MKIASTSRRVLPFVLIGFVLSGCASTAPRESDTRATQTSGASSTPTVAPLARSGVAASAESAAASREAQRAAMNGSVYYAFDQYEITTQDRSTVEANARYLRAHPGTKARIEGNADERGSREYNLALGQRRADGVMKMMSVLGVSESQMETVSYGKEKPRAAGHDEESWAQNRRSDIVYR